MTNPSNPLTMDSRKETEIIEGNRLIAEFMGHYTIDSKEWVKTNKKLVPEYLYHSSWDWLMPVLLKIKDERGIHIWGGYEIHPNWKAAVHALTFYKSNPLSAL